jgi:chitin disaccharide deacetylase
MFNRALLGAILTVLFSLYPRSVAQTYGERLGWAADQVVVILHCNEAGMTHGCNRGVFNALNRGIANSYSIVMPSSWVPGFIKEIRFPQRDDIGVEITLTSPLDQFRWGPLAGKPAVPSLVDNEGALWKSVALLTGKATADDVEREIRAQIDRLEGFGVKPSHMVSHEGAIYSKPEYLERYMKVALEKGIPPILANGHLTYFSETYTNLVDIMRARAQEAWDAGLPVVDDIHDQIGDWQVGQKKPKLIAMLHNLKPGITHINFHPAIPSDELRLITANTPSRVQDSMLLSDSEIRNVFPNKKIVTTTWRELIERRKKAVK